MDIRHLPWIQILAAAGLTAGKRVTCYEHVRLEAEQAGGTYGREQTVCDGRIVTAQTWQSHPSFYREIFARLRAGPMPLDPEVAAHLERQKDQPPRSALDVAGTREMMRRAAALAGTAPPLARVEDVLLPGSLPARQYWPARATGLPLVVYFHGGRFFSGDLESHDTVCRMLALSSGCRILAVDYRLAPEHRFPAAVGGCARAVEWAMREAAPVGVAGDSAGANLAAGAALEHRGRRCAASC